MKKRTVLILASLVPLVAVGVAFYVSRQNEPVHDIRYIYGVIRYYQYWESPGQLEGTGLVIDTIDRRYEEVYITDAATVPTGLAERILAEETWIPVKVVVETTGTRRETVRKLVAIEEYEPDEYFSRTMLNREP